MPNIHRGVSIACGFIINITGAVILRRRQNDIRKYSRRDAFDRAQVYLRQA